MTTRFVTSNQKALLREALPLTGSDGFMQDAVAFAVMRDGRDDPAAIAVFESFRGGRGEMHLGHAPGHQITADTLTGLATLAFHPRALNLDRLLARVPAWNVNCICVLLKIGFQIEYRDRYSVLGGEDGIVLSLDRGAIIHQASAGPQTEKQPETSGA